MDDHFTGETFEKLTLGIVKYLHKQDGICSIKLDDRRPTQRAVIVAWEQKYSCMLPNDIKNFYLTTDGMLLTWRFKPKPELKDSDTTSTIGVGNMEINRLENMTKVAGVMNNMNTTGPSILDLESDEEEENAVKPHFDMRSRIFDIDSCKGYGKVCLVYKNTKPGIPAQSENTEIWFLDRSLQWHYLAPSFTVYFRLMIMHLGLPQWQYAFTDMGLPPQARQWFNLYAPKRLDIDELRLSGQSKEDDVVISENPLDIGKVFRGKSDKKKMPMTNNAAGKKKAPGSGGLIGRTGGFITGKQGSILSQNAPKNTK